MAASKARSASWRRIALAGGGAWLIGGLLAGWWWASDASSLTLLDHAETVVRNGTAEMRISFAQPVAYRRHAPPGEGQIVHIELDLPGFEGPTHLSNEEYLHVPPTAGAPGFFVLYRPVRDSDVAGAPLTITVQFDAPTTYTLRPGDDGRSLILVVPTKRDGGAAAASGSAKTSN